MRILAGVVLLLLGVQEQMVAPKVEHKKHEQTTVYDEVTRTCPVGYEGHFVDPNKGFEWPFGQNSFMWGESEWAYTVCFKKEFMDEIRKNPDLYTAKPQPPKGV